MVDGARFSGRAVRSVEPAAEARQSPPSSPAIAFDDNEDTFVGPVRRPTLTAPVPQSMEWVNTKGEGRSSGPIERPSGQVSPGASEQRRGEAPTPIQSQPGDTWASVAERHYGRPISPHLQSLLASENNIGPGGGVPDVVQMPSLRALYRLTHAAERRAPNPAHDRATIVIAEPTSNWQGIMAAHYGERLPADVQLHALEMVARVNGRSVWEPPPEVVSLPSDEDLANWAVRLQGMERFRVQHRAQLPPRDTSLLIDMGGTLDAPGKVPTAGQAYAPVWSDTLRGLTLHAYRDQLADLPPEQAARRLELMMMLLAEVNGLATSEVGLYSSLFIPTGPSMRQLVAELESNEEFTQAARGSPLWRQIQGAGRGAKDDARVLMQAAAPAPHVERPSASRQKAAQIAHIDSQQLSRQQSASTAPSLTNAAIVEIQPDDTAEDVLDRNIPFADGSQRAEHLGHVRDILSVRQANDCHQGAPGDGRYMRLHPQPGESDEAVLRRTFRDSGLPAASAAYLLELALPHVEHSEGGDIILDIDSVMASELYGLHLLPCSPAGDACRLQVRNAVRKIAGQDNSLSVQAAASAVSDEHYLEQALAQVGLSRDKLDNRRFEAMLREMKRRAEGRVENRRTTHKYVDDLQLAAREVSESTARMMRAKGRNV